MKHTCIQCGIIFEAKREDAKFHSDSCRIKYSRQHPNKPKPAGIPKVKTKTVIRDLTPKPTGITKNVIKPPEKIETPAGRTLIYTCRYCKKKFLSQQYKGLCNECEGMEHLTEEPAGTVHHFNKTTWFTVEDNTPLPKYTDKPISNLYNDVK